MFGATTTIKPLIITGKRELKGDNGIYGYELIGITMGDTFNIRLADTDLDVYNAVIPGQSAVADCVLRNQGMGKMQLNLLRLIPENGNGKPLVTKSGGVVPEVQISLTSSNKPATK